MLLISTAGFLNGADSTESKALTFLARDVPAWPTENKCFSCHNNGDGARALMMAVRLGRPVPQAALKDTLDWLRRPRDWNKEGGDERNKNETLGRIQFAAALVDAVEVGLITDRDAVASAAALVALGQQKDGSWRPDVAEIGSPTTYGTALSTHLARQVLLKTDPKRYREAIGRAEQWLIALDVKSVYDAAVVLWALEEAGGKSAEEQRQRCLEIIKKGRGDDGGWGPYITSASEPFDTAIVMLSLNQFRKEVEMEKMLVGGRAYLGKQQSRDGDWPPTTRPAGGESYAQRISTTAWVSLALLSRKKVSGTY
jgi:hypothetical protein